MAIQTDIAIGDIEYLMAYNKLVECSINSPVIKGQRIRTTARAKFNVYADKAAYIAKAAPIDEHTSVIQPGFFSTSSDPFKVIVVPSSKENV